MFKKGSLDVSAPNYGETPYETEHQVCRGDREEDLVKKTNRSEPVKSQTSCVSVGPDVVHAESWKSVCLIYGQPYEPN
ncbi:hypothetical protein F2P81_013992 [Scophthalmus maximus]|uniref:Uncharacterized protein n=1 Tax=Scophthalmus maximus TaxID=52904 RepID=A0A6A4SFJ8_SCOMX|nr:hypothetical protein F2P81_013992 [Scophthalmus maximus]